MNVVGMYPSCHLLSLRPLPLHLQHCHQTLKSRRVLPTWYILHVSPIFFKKKTSNCSQFAAWATYTDGHLIGVDNEVTQNYMLTLRAFSSLGSVETKDKDHEFRNRWVFLSLVTISTFNNA